MTLHRTGCGLTACLILWPLSIWFIVAAIIGAVLVIAAGYLDHGDDDPYDTTLFGRQAATDREFDAIVAELRKDAP